MIARDRRNDIARGLNTFLYRGRPISYFGCEGLPAFVLSGRKGDRVEHSCVPSDAHRHRGASSRCVLASRAVTDGRFFFGPTDIPGSEVRELFLLLS